MKGRVLIGVEECQGREGEEEKEGVGGDFMKGGEGIH